MGRAKKVKYSYYGGIGPGEGVFIGRVNELRLYDFDGNLLSQKSQSGSWRHLSLSNDTLYGARSGPGGAASFTYTNNTIAGPANINVNYNQVGGGVSADVNALYFTGNRTILAGNKTVRKFSLVDGTQLATADTGDNAQGVLPVDVNGTTKICVDSSSVFKIYDADLNEEFSTGGGGAVRDLYYVGNTLYRFDQATNAIVETDLTTNITTNYKTVGLGPVVGMKEFTMNDDYIIVGAPGTTGSIAVYDNQAVGKPLLRSWEANVGNINSVDIDTNNNIYVGGDTNGPGGLGTKQSLKKFDINGNELWTKSFGVCYVVTLLGSGSYKGTRYPL